MTMVAMEQESQCIKLIIPNNNIINTTAVFIPAKRFASWRTLWITENLSFMMTGTVKHKKKKLTKYMNGYAVVQICNFLKENGIDYRI